MDTETKQSIGVFKEWLIGSCRISPSMAQKIAESFVVKFGFSDIEQLLLSQEADENWLNDLGFELPNMTKMLIKTNVAKIGRVPLQSLTVEDVAMVIHQCFSEFPYHLSFKENLISGFNLQFVCDLDTLKQFGIPHDHHATALMQSIDGWRKFGVPVSMLSLTDAEHQRRLANIKEEVIQLKAAPAKQQNSAPPAPQMQEAANDDEVSIVSADQLPREVQLGQISAQPIVLYSSSESDSDSGDVSDASVASCGEDVGVPATAAERHSAAAAGGAEHPPNSPPDRSAHTPAVVSGSVGSASVLSKKALTSEGKARAKPLPAHTLLSESILSRFSDHSSSTSGSQQVPEVSSGSGGDGGDGGSGDGSGDGSAEGPPDIRNGTWEYRSTLSPEGKDRRMLVFVPRTEKPTPQAYQAPQPSGSELSAAAKRGGEHGLSQAMDQEMDCSSTADFGAIFDHDDHQAGPSLSIGASVWTSESDGEAKDRSDDSTFEPALHLTGDGVSSDSDSSDSEMSYSSDSEVSDAGGVSRRPRKVRRDNKRAAAGRGEMQRGAAKKADDAVERGRRSKRKRTRTRRLSPVLGGPSKQRYVAVEREASNVASIKPRRNSTGKSDTSKRSPTFASPTRSSKRRRSVPLGNGSSSSAISSASTAAALASLNGTIKLRFQALVRNCRALLKATEEDEIRAAVVRIGDACKKGKILIYNWH